MKINDRRKRDKTIILGDCHEGDIVEIDGFEGSFLVSDYKPCKDQTMVVRLSDGFMFICQICTSVCAINCELVITE